MKPMKKDFWLWFIDHTNEEMIKLSCVTNEQIEEARKQLNKIRANEELMDYMNSKAFYISLSGSNIRKVAKEGLQSIYSLTRVLPGTRLTPME